MEHSDKRLEKIRRYQGTIQDLVDFIKDKEKETAGETEKSDSIMMAESKPSKKEEDGK